MIKTKSQRCDKMFDYEKFENDIVNQVEKTLKKWMEEHEDIYILSLDCTREMDSVGIIANTKQYLEEQAEPDDYWYYKYCEEEWELFHTFQGISSYMRQYTEENEETFSEKKNDKYYEYTEKMDAHCDKMIETCKKALCRLKQSISETYPDLLLTFYIREYLEEEERGEIFEMINGEEAAKEYVEHLEDFV